MLQSLIKHNFLITFILYTSLCGAGHNVKILTEKLKFFIFVYRLLVIGCFVKYIRNVILSCFFCNRVHLIRTIAL